MSKRATLTSTSALSLSNAGTSGSSKSESARKTDWEEQLSDMNGATAEDVQRYKGLHRSELQPLTVPGSGCEQVGDLQQTVPALKDSVGYVIAVVASSGLAATAYQLI
jgi:hypothetical protein